MDSVLQAFKENIEKAIQLIIAAVPKIAEKQWDEENKELNVWLPILIFIRYVSIDPRLRNYFVYSCEKGWQIRVMPLSGRCLI